MWYCGNVEIWYCGIECMFDHLVQRLLWFSAVVVVVDEFVCPNGYTIGISDVSMKLNTLDFVNRVDNELMLDV